MSEDTNAWVRLFHPRCGVDVRIPLTQEVNVEYGCALISAVDCLLEAGWLVTAPGVEPGEEREEIGWVCRLDHEKDGETTPTVLLYSTNSQLSYSFLRRYLNTSEDVIAFEQVSGLKYDALPPYPGNDHPERGASPKTDKFIIKSPRPFTVVWKQNPRYKDAPAGQDTRTLAEKRKRDFVRWQGSKTETKSEAKPEAKPEPPKTPSKPNHELWADRARNMNDWRQLKAAIQKTKEAKFLVDEESKVLYAIRERACELLMFASTDAADQGACDLIAKEVEDPEWSFTREQKRDINQSLSLQRAAISRNTPEKASKKTAKAST